jgi:CDP-diglyceride synthetase
MRQRAISAAVLVPVLLLVLAISEAVLAAVVVLVTALAAVEAFRLLKAAGYPPLPALGTPALAVVLDAAFPICWKGAGCCSARSGSCSWRWPRSPPGSP